MFSCEADHRRCESRGKREFRARRYVVDNLGHRSPLVGAFDFWVCVFEDFDVSRSLPHGFSAPGRSPSTTFSVAFVATSPLSSAASVAWSKESERMPTVTSVPSRQRLCALPLSLLRSPFASVKLLDAFRDDFAGGAVRRCGSDRLQHLASLRRSAARRSAHVAHPAWPPRSPSGTACSRSRPLPPPHAGHLRLPPLRGRSGLRPGRGCLRAAGSPGLRRRGSVPLPAWPAAPSGSPVWPARLAAARGRRRLADSPRPTLRSGPACRQVPGSPRPRETV